MTSQKWQSLVNDKLVYLYVGKINNIIYYANSTNQRLAVYPPKSNNDAIVNSGALPHTIHDDAPIDKK